MGLLTGDSNILWKYLPYGTYFLRAYNLKLTVSFENKHMFLKRLYKTLLTGKVIKNLTKF